jgi:isoquinoline 1-oxidoreductase beta subunit
VAGVAKTVTAEYRAPFLAHAAMEPINCTAQVAGGKVRLWVSTQVPSIAVDVAAKVAGVAREDVAIEVMLLGAASDAGSRATWWRRRWRWRCVPAASRCS